MRDGRASHQHGYRTHIIPQSVLRSSCDTRITEPQSKVLIDSWSAQGAQVLGQAFRESQPFDLIIKPPVSFTGNCTRQAQDAQTTVTGHPFDHFQSAADPFEHSFMNTWNCYSTKIHAKYESDVLLTYGSSWTAFSGVNGTFTPGWYDVIELVVAQQVDSFGFSSAISNQNDPKS